MIAKPWQKLLHKETPLLLVEKAIKTGFVNVRFLYFIGFWVRGEIIFEL